MDFLQVCLVVSGAFAAFSLGIAYKSAKDAELSPRAAIICRYLLKAVRLAILIMGGVTISKALLFFFN